MEVTKAFASRLEALDSFQSLASRTGVSGSAPDCEAVILLAGADVFSEWSCHSGALGCLAVTSGPFFDQHEDESGFNHRLMIAVNIDLAKQEIRGLYVDNYDEYGAFREFLATIAHEGVHLSDFVKVSGGRTPHEVYTDGANPEWEVTQAVTLEETEWDPCPGGDDAAREEDNENRAEELAHRFVREISFPFDEKAFDAIISDPEECSP